MHSSLDEMIHRNDITSNLSNKCRSIMNKIEYSDMGYILKNIKKIYSTVNIFIKLIIALQVLRPTSSVEYEKSVSNICCCSHGVTYI